MLSLYGTVNVKHLLLHKIPQLLSICMCNILLSGPQHGLRMESRAPDAENLLNDRALSHGVDMLPHDARSNAVHTEHAATIAVRDAQLNCKHVTIYLFLKNS